MTQFRKKTDLPARVRRALEAVADLLRGPKPVPVRVRCGRPIRR